MRVVRKESPGNKRDGPLRGATTILVGITPNFSFVVQSFSLISILHPDPKCQRQRLLSVTPRVGRRRLMMRGENVWDKER